MAIDVKTLLEKPLWQMTGKEFLELNQQLMPGILAPTEKAECEPPQSYISPEKKYVYGISGIARLFGCSIPTASRIKQSGKINKAITQIGRKIIVDADMALALAGQKTGGRK